MNDIEREFEDACKKAWAERDRTVYDAQQKAIRAVEEALAVRSKSRKKTELPVSV
jgi:hypothetical protein